MFPILPLRSARSPPPPGRSRSDPARPVDEPRPDSPLSDDCSFFEGTKESVISLDNPWPPTPPQIDSPTSSTPTINEFSESRDGLIAFASRPGQRSDNRLLRSFNLTAEQTPMQFIIAIVPADGKPGYYTFSLSLRVGGLHRSICEPATLRLTIEPRQLDFDVFLFPPRHSLPRKCLYSLRVWLRYRSVYQRIFADDALWIGTNPNFAEIPGATASMAWNQTPDQQVYRCIVGRAEVAFTLRWKMLKESIYSLNLEYEAGGVGKPLLEDMVVRLDFSPRNLGCYIYTIPLDSKPPGATHRVRVWLRSPSPFNAEGDSFGSYVYQRIWSTDEFRLGGYLDFTAIDPKRVILATPTGRPSLRIRTMDSYKTGDMKG